MIEWILLMCFLWLNRKVLFQRMSPETDYHVASEQVKLLTIGYGHLYMALTGGSNVHYQWSFYDFYNIHIFDKSLVWRLIWCTRIKYWTAIHWKYVQLFCHHALIAGVMIIFCFIFLIEKNITNYVDYLMTTINPRFTKGW